MIGRLFSMLPLIASGYFLFRYRYRVLNFVLSQRWIRRAVVSYTMQIPFVRNNMMSNMFKTPETNR
ncbi:sodium:proton antiporter [Bacillus sp. FJAT-45350]|uniref:sodium:proton antiporter n=1 Tax=Bacillus sp. FJAT-45350 TaxID=2011014 RepID=UPI000BB72A01|nr:sodium:proton antiporter [Bacillus sp. FJAT-45350]